MAEPRDRRPAPVRRRPVGQVAAAVTVAVGVLCGLVGGVAVGWPGLLAGLLAAVVVVVFLGSSGVPMLLLRGFEGNAGLGLVVLLVNYVFRLVAALLLLALAVGAGLADRAAVGLTVVVCTLAWTTTHVVVLGRPPRITPGAHL